MALETTNSALGNAARSPSRAPAFLAGSLLATMIIATVMVIALASGVTVTAPAAGVAGPLQGEADALVKFRLDERASAISEAESLIDFRADERAALRPPRPVDNAFEKAHAANAANAANHDLVVRSEHGGLRYVGIPYPAPDSGSGGSNGTRLPQ